MELQYEFVVKEWLALSLNVTAHGVTEFKKNQELKQVFDKIYSIWAKTEIWWNGKHNEILPLICAKFNGGSFKI